jgi:PBSX family phage terminase large subunit
MPNQNNNEKFYVHPTAKQAEFILSTQKFSCFSGGFGNGKTTAGCLKGIALSQFPGNFGLVGRLTYPELRDTTRRSFFEMCPPEYYDKANGGEWRRSENHLILSNGSEVIFRHLDTIAEKELLSLNLGWFYIDQAEEINESLFLILQSRLRLNTVPRRYGFVTCNPEPGNWIYDRFAKPAQEGRLAKDHFYVTATTKENPHLPPDYVPTLLASYPEELIKRYIEGKWEVFEGQIYPEFDQSIHVIKPFDIPKGWERIIAIDHGLMNPTCALWGAIDYDNNLYIYDEYYEPGIVSKHAEIILNKSIGQEISMWLIDPSTANKTREKEGMPWSIMEEYEDYGIYAIPANNQMLAGINRVKEFLKLDPRRINPQTHEAHSPRLFIMANCTSTIWEFPQYQWKKMKNITNRNEPERPRDFNDHAMDALRYLILSRFPPPTKNPRGDSLVQTLRQKGTRGFANQIPDDYVGDSQFGAYSGGLNLYTEEGVNKEWKQS